MPTFKLRTRKPSHLTVCWLCVFCCRLCEFTRGSVLLWLHDLVPLVSSMFIGSYNPSAFQSSLKLERRKLMKTSSLGLSDPRSLTRHFLYIVQLWISLFFSHLQEVGSYCCGGSWLIYRYSRKLLRVFLLLPSFWSTVIFVFLLGLSNLKFMATLAVLGLKFCLTIHWCLQTGHRCS